MPQANDLNQFWFETCELTFPLNAPEIGPILDDVGFIAVTCFEPGEFTLSIGDRSRDDRVRFEIACFGQPDVVEVLANPARVELVPAAGSTAHSLIQVFLYSEDDGAVAPDTEVQFLVDRCAMETEGVNSVEERDLALDEEIGPGGLPLSFEDWEDFANEEEPDSKPLVDVFEPEGADGAGVLQIHVADDDDDIIADYSEALAIFHADAGSEHAGKCAPGPVKLTVIVEVDNDEEDEDEDEDEDHEVSEGADIVLTLTLTVVGPPASIGLSAEPTAVRCGELARIIAVVLDAIGQPVSDHTLLEAVTNYGGALGGTGAVAGQQGNVVPLSSTVAETFEASPSSI